MSVLGGINSNADIGEKKAASALSAASSMTAYITNDLSTEYFYWTAGQNETVDLSGAHPRGKEIVFEITNDGTLARVITFGTGLLALGTLTGIILKTSIVRFISNGSTFRELGRTVGL